MHKLHRAEVPPGCLSRFHHGLNQWREVLAADREAIWAKLDDMQQGRCAYCESSFPQQNGRYAAHIEHFRQRDRFPEGTFDWLNLFGSCDRQDSCGKHKDRCGAYNPADLIKPDVDDPEIFFIFVVDGSIAIRQDLSEEQQHRAKETLRIFNLDAKYGALRQMRESMVSGYQQTAEELLTWAIEYPDEYPELLQQELDDVANLPFVTAIRHILQGD